MGWKKYFEVTKINFSNSLTYVWDFLMHSLFIGLIIFVFINLWKVVYGGTNLIEGYTLNMMVWYLVLAEAIVTSQRRLIPEMGEEIQSGDIAQRLNKPYNYILFKYFVTIAQGLFRFSLNFLVGGLVALIFIGGIELQWSTLPLVGISVLLALTLHFCGCMILGLFTFWIEDARSLDFIYSKLVFILGGMLVPLEIFPDWLKKICLALPFSSIAYSPAKLFVRFNWPDFIHYILIQIIWLALAIFIIIIIYKICIKKISINGG